MKADVVLAGGTLCGRWCTLPVVLHIGDGWDVELWTSETADGALVAGTTDVLSILVQLDVALVIGVWTSREGAEEPMDVINESTFPDTFSSFSFTSCISVSMLLYVLLQVFLTFSRCVHLMLLLSFTDFSCI